MYGALSVKRERERECRWMFSCVSSHFPPALDPRLCTIGGMQDRYEAPMAVSWPRGQAVHFHVFVARLPPLLRTCVFAPMFM